MSAAPDDLPPTLLNARDALFREIATGSGLVAAATVDHVAASQDGSSLGERLVRAGHISESGRRAVEQLVSERETNGASASTQGSTATGPYKPAPTVEHVAPAHAFGEYELLGEIARGGMGVVYRARQTRLNRPVALKMIRAGGFAGDHEVRRFQAEARAAGQLDHPGIVPVFEVGEIAGQHFFSMALVDGPSLNARIKERGPLDPRAAARLVRAVAEAVAYAHTRGIVHRDLKPHNILLADGDEPRVTDFGLAKHALADSELTATGQVMGTPSYMPPEQAAGEAARVGPAADVYALGATLYCALTGRPPFQASSSARTIQQVLTEPPPPPRRLNPEVPLDLETVCLKCLEKKPGARYASATELADELGRFLAGEPIRARPVGALERGWKWARRRPVAAALAAVSTVALGALVAVAVISVYQVRLAGLNDQLETRNTELQATTRVAELASGEANRERDAVTRAKLELAQFRYASDVAIAGRAWREGDVARMSGLLDRLAPKPGEEDLRGFEWHYLRGLERHELWRLENARCVLAPNGKVLAAPQNGALELLDADTRKLLHRLPEPAVFAPGFAFSADSKRVAFATAANEVAVWDVGTGTEVKRLRADDLNVAVVGLSPDGALATAYGQGNDRAIRVWEVATGKQLHRWATTGGYIGPAAFAPDGSRLAFCVRGAIEVHDLKTGARAFAFDADKVSPTRSLQYHPSGRWLVVTHFDERVLAWSAADGRPAAPPFLAAGLSGTAVAFTPDGRFVATAAAKDNTVRLWNGTTGAPLSARKGHTQAPFTVRIAPDGARVFSTAFDDTGRMWDTRGHQEHDDIPGGFALVRFVPDPRSRALALLGAGRTIQFRDATAEPAFPDLKGGVFEFEYSADGARVFARHYDGTLETWDARTRKRLHVFEPKVFKLVVHPNGRWLAGHCDDHTVRVWDAHTYARLHEIPTVKNNHMVSLFPRPGTDELLVSQYPEPLKLVTVGPTPKVEALSRPSGGGTLAFSPDGKRLATNGGPRQFAVFSFPQFEVIHELQGHADMITDFAFNADGTRLATISRDRTVRLWDMLTGQEVLTLAVASGHQLVFSPDGRRLVAFGGVDGARIWDTARGRAAPPK